jgi:hypothetical protein
VSSVPGGAGNGETADRVAAAAGELYGTDPQEFMDRRKALSTAAREAGDADAARQIAALRKPTRAAWVVNTLTRADPGAKDLLASLAAGLRAAQLAKDGRRLRELSAERGSLIDALTGQALTAAGVPDAPSGLRDEVSETLTAALADPEVAAALATGTLTRAAQWAGFGLALPGPDDAGAADAGASSTGAAEAAPPAAAADRAAAQVTRLEEARRRRERRGVAAGDGERRDAEAEAASRRQAQDDIRRQRQADEERRLAKEAAQAAVQRRQIFEDAEREVASAATIAMDAVAAEDRLEREVRDLEDRLTRTRAELADARLRARRAEAAERKARQTLARLPRPGE